MQTNFTLAQLADPKVAVADTIIRKCVHCGFCTATCPTYVLRGDENDSPRGRIYLIKQTLESGQPPSAAVTLHVDRCLSCLSCMTTCPSGVDYMHLIDIARTRIEAGYRRPWADRLLRRMLGAVLPHPRRFRAVMVLAWMAKPLGLVLPQGRLAAMLALAPVGTAAAPLRPQVFPAQGQRRMRVALLAGCVQQVIAANINAATIRLLTRHGCEVVIAAGAGCCGALTHHLGREDEARSFARRNIAAWLRERDRHGLDAIIVNASGCGTVLKDYGHMLRQDPHWAEGAAAVAALAKDVSEVMAALGLQPGVVGEGTVVAYHAACSLQHGQRIRQAPQTLLNDAGFVVREPAEGHLCCGSAGVYNILEPVMARQLRERKAGAIEDTGPQIIAAGNVGCILQIAGGTRLPVVHTVELLDWATGGPRPSGL